MTHKLKTDPLPFQATWDGRKTFEIRKDDRHFQVGDILDLQETESSAHDMSQGARLEYTGRAILKVVTHIMRGPIYGCQPGWVVMSIKEAK